VLDAMDDYYRRSHANVHRGVHTLAEEATSAYEGARAAVADFIGARDRAEVVFTGGTTEAINLVAASWGQANLGPDDAVLLTTMEHHANLVPWQLLAERTGVELRHLPLDPDGALDLSSLDDLLDERVKLVSFVHVSNTLGLRNPVAEIVAAARAVGARVLLDAAQSVAHMPLDVGELDVDFLAFGGHKMLGPTGIGVLWARRELLDAMPPWQGGGEMIRRVGLQRSTYNDAPFKFEAGTPPIAEAVGLHAAITYLGAVGMEAVGEHGRALAKAAACRLADIPGLRLLGGGPEVEREGVVSFTLEGVHPHDLATILDGQGIAVRAGHHCTMPLHEALGIPASTRASFAMYNDLADVDALAEGLEAARGIFGLG
jgi:cysteine desulfurase/selenocysteine lyase